jgi:hypothetical protein
MGHESFRKTTREFAVIWLCIFIFCGFDIFNHNCKFLCVCALGMTFYLFIYYSVVVIK